MAGCLGSSKKNIKSIADKYSHSVMMHQTRSEMIRLRDFMEKLGFPIISIQTDAIFIDCETL